MQRIIRHFSAIHLFLSLSVGRWRHKDDRKIPISPDRFTLCYLMPTLQLTSASRNVRLSHLSSCSLITLSPGQTDSQIVASWKFGSTCDSVWPSLACTCDHFGRDQSCMQVDASFLPFGHPTQVSSQVQLAATCDYWRVRLTRALRQSLPWWSAFSLCVHESTSAIPRTKLRIYRCHYGAFNTKLHVLWIHSSELE